MTVWDCKSFRDSDLELPSIRYTPILPRENFLSFETAARLDHVACCLYRWHTLASTHLREVVSMKREFHRWYSHRLGLELGVVVYGHWGSPLLGFPTSAGDEWELEGQSLIGALADFIDAGKLKFFTVNSINGLSFYNQGAHPFHRSYVQSMFDSYLREEVVPFIWDNCQSQGIAISTMGASFGAYHAANSLFKHPDVIKRCFALSGVYDMKKFMDGMFDDNFYFNNPVDYLQNLTDPWVYGQLASCDIHLSTGHGQWEKPAPTYRLSEILNSKGIRHSLDNWGDLGGHDWPYWKHQMREYVSRLF